MRPGGTVLTKKRYRRLDLRLTVSGAFVFGNTTGGPIEPWNFVRREWKTACNDIYAHVRRERASRAAAEYDPLVRPPKR